MEHITHYIGKEKRSLNERGLSDNSHFEAHFKDIIATEHTTNWSDISETKEVILAGNPYTVSVCTHPISKLKIYHAGLSTEIKVPEGHHIYQAIQGLVTFLPNGKTSSHITGRVIGLIKDGIVVEERLLSNDENVVKGFKL